MHDITIYCYYRALSHKSNELDMIMKNSNNRKSFVKRHIHLICTNAVVVIIFILGFFKGTVSIAQLLLMLCMLLFIINIWPIIDGVWSVYGIEKEVLDKDDNKKILIATLIMTPIMGLNLFFLIFKGMIWVSYIIIVICNIFCFFLFMLSSSIIEN